MCLECVPQAAIQLKLLSTAFVHTPGMLLACINDYKFKGKPRNRAIQTMLAWESPNFNKDVVSRLLSGEIPYTTVKEYDEKAKMELEHVIISI